MKKEKKKEEQEEALIPTSEEDELVPVAEKSEIEPVKEKVEEKKADEQPRQTFGQITRRFVLAVLRLIIIVAVIGGCGAAIYFGAPFLYESFVQPVEENTSQMNDINLRQSQSEFQIADLQTRLATLEAGQNAQSNSITDIDSRIQSLEAVQTDQNEVASHLDSRLKNLEGADARRNESLAGLTYQSDLLRVMELLSRARLFLYQSNFGLARADVQVARDILAEMQSSAPESKQKDLKEALLRLDMALKNLPAFPVAASDDLDIAWQILLEGYPVASTATPTPVPTTTPEVTATPIPNLTATPTP